MTIEEAICNRHSVRNYKSSPIDENAVSVLSDEINDINQKTGLSICLVIDEPTAFSECNSYGRFKGVRNYIVMGGKDTFNLDEKVGFYGEMIVLKAQMLGLNTCWVGQTFSKSVSKSVLNKGEKVVCCIAIGYGENDGIMVKHKKVTNVSNVSKETPMWFNKGVQMALLAPTAFNQQLFRFEYIKSEKGEKAKVRAQRMYSIRGFSQVDLGIVKLHFELGAGRENFEWIDGGVRLKKRDRFLLSWVIAAMGFSMSVFNRYDPNSRSILIFLLCFIFGPALLLAQMLAVGYWNGDN